MPKPLKPIIPVPNVVANAATINRHWSAVCPHSVQPAYPRPTWRFISEYALGRVVLQKSLGIQKY